MYSNNSQGRASNGYVQIKPSNGRLQLVFSHPILTPQGEIKSKRFYVSTGEADTPYGRQRASVLAAKIDVARWVGNSPEVIYKHYAGNKRDLQVPEL